MSKFFSPGLWAPEMRPTLTAFGNNFPIDDEHRFFSAYAVNSRGCLLFEAYFSDANDRYERGEVML